MRAAKFDRRETFSLAQVIESCHENMRHAAEAEAKARRDLRGAAIGSQDANRARDALLRALEEKRHWREMCSWWVRCEAERPDLLDMPAPAAAHAWFHGRQGPATEVADDEPLPF